ncbi:MAG: S-layer homology domain-containing protein [Clostridiaceae bacterium]|nr:S-layer homology domain-containing protein [Clostridiaceae bacterium]
MGNSNFKRFACVMLSILLVMSSIAYAQANTDAAEYPDIAGNKYEARLREWIDNGFIKGNPDGSFKPYNTITRAEFMALVNRSFGFTEAAEIDFTDVRKENWFYEDAAKAVKAGYMQGYDGKLFPLESISRQAFATVLARLTGGETAADDTVINSLTDSKSIPEWSKAAISTVINKGYFKELISDAFKPEEKVTRLEAVVALDRAFKSMYKAVYSKGGTYGPASGIMTFDGNVAIISPNVTLKNMAINGDLVLRESIGDGNVHLDNVTVKGTTIVRGGGENSITISNSSLGRVRVIREGNIVRIVAIGSTTIGEVDMRSGAILQEEYLTGDGFGDIVIPDDIFAGAAVIFEGDFDNITVDSSNVNINLVEGTIGNLTLTQQAAGTTVNLAQETSIDILNINAAVNITGQGSIQTANINASGSTIQQQPENVVVAPGASAVINNQTVTKSMTVAPPKVSSGGGGGGRGGSSGNPTIINVTGVFLDKTTMTLTAKGPTGTLVATVTPSNASNKKVEWSSSNTSVATVKEGVVKPLQVGTATITVTTASGNKTAECIVTVEEQVIEVDKGVLISLIDVAKEKAKNAVIGDDAGEYPEEAVNELLEAIGAAQAVVDDDDATQDEVDVAVTALSTAVADFEATVITAPGTYIVNVLKNPTNGGEVTVTGAVYGEEKNIFKEGEKVKLTAIPNKGYEFVNWTSDMLIIKEEDKTNNPYTFTMLAENVSITANFSVKVNAIEIDGEAKVGEILEASNLKPLNATVNYQWQRADTEKDKFEDIVGATNDSYTLTGEDEGKYIRIVATGIGNYTGVVESDSVGPVAPEVDKSALQSAIDGASGFNEEEYTAESWAAFQETLSDAENVFYDENATQEEVDIATINLNNAIDGLEKVVSPIKVLRNDGEVTQDPGFTGGTGLEYSFDAETSILTINAKGTTLPYYPQSGTTPPTGANWVGVAIPVLEDVDNEQVTATIKGTTCTDLFFAEGKYMEYINVKEADLEVGAAAYAWVIKWGAGYADETITINLINVGGLEAPPKLEGVTPESSAVTLDYGKTFVFTVDAYDEGGLSELEIDHSMSSILPEFSVYADVYNPYGEDKVEFEAVGVIVTYDDDAQKWTIDFGKAITGQIVDNGGITFYIVIKDTAGNQFGSMYETTPENTFAYNVETAGGIEAEDFGFANGAGSAGARLTEGKAFKDVESLEVKWFDYADNLLLTGNLNLAAPGINLDLNSISMPFDPEFDYETDGFWDVTWEADGKKGEPTKVVFKVVFKNRITDTAENISGYTLITVGSSGADYTTIQDAVDAAEDGNIILVAGG